MYSRCCCWLFLFHREFSVRHRPLVRIHNSHILQDKKSMPMAYWAVVWVESANERTAQQYQHIAMARPASEWTSATKRKRVVWRARRRRQRRLEWISRDLIINNENASKSFLHVFKFNIFILRTVDEIDLVLWHHSAPPLRWRHWWR